MNKAILLLFLIWGAYVVAVEEEKIAVDHSSWNTQLQAYLKAGQVDYSAWKKEEAVLDSYLNDMAALDDKKMAKNDRLALYINLYNAWTVKLILKNWNKKIKSIKDIPNRWSTALVRLKGRNISLEDLENDILRKEFKDSRIHFAINCASIGCPDLWNKAYSAKGIEEELNDARTRFFDNSIKGVMVSKEKGTFYGENYILRISKIFSWFDKDFEDESKTVLDYVEQHGNKTQKVFIKKYKDDIDIEYFDYDWKLNGR